MNPARIRWLACLIVLAARVSICVADDQPDETWEAVFLGEDKVGYVHTVTRPTKEGGKDAVRVQLESFMSIVRFGQAVEMKMVYDSLETPDGKVLRVDNRGLEARTQGVVDGKSMKLTVETSGRQTTTTIPWGNDVLGPAAEERILKKQPLKPGEKRSYRSFMPDLNIVVTNSYYGEEQEEVKLLDGSVRKLQRVRAEIDGVPALKNIKTYRWVDEKGESHKTHTTMLAGMTTYRVSKEVAVAPAGAFSMDFGVKSLMRVEKKIPKALESTEIVYRIELKDEDPREVFPLDERQSLGKGQDGAWLLTIRSLDPTKLPAKEIAKTESAQFLHSNNWLQTDNAKVIEVARKAVGDATDPWDKARRIEKWVHQNLTEKNFSKIFDSAAVVAEKLQGDCTEHGVLLAAMARVAGIPSRVAIGLIYAERFGAFGYHMWAEVQIHGHWIPLDGTLGLGHASPAHIKLGDSSLDGADALTTLLPVARVMGGLTIEVVSWKHAEAK